MFIRFDRMYERDGHTHTDTHETHHMNEGIDRACMASRGKNNVNACCHKHISTIVYNSARLM